MKSIKRIGRLLLVNCVVLFTGCTDSGDSTISLIQPAAEAVFDDTAEFSGAEEGIYVHICGEVGVPGVYSMPAGSRIVDAVNAAGGLSEKADAGTVNLALLLEDGMQIRIPQVADGEQDESGTVQDGRVDINHASLDELCSLPGIGKTRAAEILRYREESGAFRVIEDIMKVSGIKRGLFEKIKEKICVR